MEGVYLIPLNLCSWDEFVIVYCWFPTAFQEAGREEWAGEISEGVRVRVHSNDSVKLTNLPLMHGRCVFCHHDIDHTTNILIVSSENI